MFCNDALVNFNSLSPSPTITLVDVFLPLGNSKTWFLWKAQIVLIASVLTHSSSNKNLPSDYYLA